MIAITGASGNLGQLTLSHLTKKMDPNRVVAVVRDPKKLTSYRDSGIAIRQADYDDPESLVRAFSGVEKLLQISASATGALGQQHELNVVKAAKAAGVEKIIYTSTLTPSPNAVFGAGRICSTTEQAIKDSGLDYTFFRNSMYQETIPMFIGSAVQDGQIYYPSGEGKVSFAARTDMAEALANVLTGDGHHKATYRITGDEAFSFADIATLLRSEKRLDATHHDIPSEAYKEELGKTGLPQSEIDFIASMAASIRIGEFSAVDDQLENLLGRPRFKTSDYIRSL
ncbi:SDR family oxidoreductase [Parapedobacter tibetensis]|uniref:SDR family oxidoreductase n=1 Tax=Parapedobacter tibetensis TaxID=2972951 RepID=UPI00214D40DE|nr:SDR family oxidoreductase [Parapedobacter tibetensis]